MNFKNLTSAIVCVLALSLTLFSCKDDPTVVGSWQTEVLSDTACNDASDNASLNFDTNGQACEDVGGATYCFDQTITFTDTNITITSSGTIDGVADPDSAETETGTYTIDGDRMTITIDGDAISGAYTVTDDAFTFRSDADATDGCVVNIVASR